MKNKNHGIAIIGLSCRFPQAKDLKAFWKIIAEGKSVFQEMPTSRRKLHSTHGINEIKGGFIDNPYLFDNGRFNIESKDALSIDPQQRIMLELAIEAMENAGYSELANQSVGVFVGADQMAYQEMITSQFYRNKVVDYIAESKAFRNIPESYKEELHAELDAIKQLQPLHPEALVGNLINMIPGRIAHELNLKGPALSVDTACSSSLVAVHLAIESLKRGECNSALVGGVNLNLTPSVFQYMSAAGVISPSGKCIPFSKDSDGILLGEGAGMILLKRLEDAQRDGDGIYAVIQGSSINNDGRSLGVMAPSWKGQLALLKNTYEKSGIDPSSISAIEAHGTSTRIGDGVELSVIEKFFPLNQENPIFIGSIKSNFGHTLAASGIAGLLKMVLSIHNKQIPSSLHETIDPKKKLKEKGIIVPTQLTEWESTKLRSAGVSSFGFGGTNAHLILQEPVASPRFKSIPTTINSSNSFFYDFFPQLNTLKSPVLQRSWEESELVSSTASFTPATWIIIGFDEEKINNIQEQLSYNESKHLSVLCSLNTDSDFIRHGENKISIDPGNPDHYRWLMNFLDNDQELGIIYLGSSYKNDMASDLFIEKILSGFRFLVQSLSVFNKAKVWAHTSDAYSVLNSEECKAQQRAISVLASSAMEENQSICGAIIDSPLSSSKDISDFCSIIGCFTAAPMIVRNGKLFSPVLSNITKKESKSPKFGLKKDGNYLIIGGSSGIGKCLVEFLIKKQVKNVILTGTRTKGELPQELLDILDQNTIYIQNDILDRVAVQALITKLFQNYGKIDGIIYAAGAITLGSLVSKDQKSFEKVLKTKISGGQNLREALMNKSPGFVYTLSSISSLTPQWASGISDYAAANAFLDGLAEEHHNHYEFPWISCSWSAWEDTGMATSMKGLIEGFKVEEALAIFEETITSGISHVIAMPLAQKSKYSNSFSQKKRKIKIKENITIIDKEANNHSIETVNKPLQLNNQGVVELLKEYVAEAVEMNIDEIDENVSFYEFGLDSLSAMDVAQKIESVIGKELHPTILFECDTIAALAEYLEKGESKLVEKEAIIDIHNFSHFPLIGSQKAFFANQQFYPEKPCNILVSIDLEDPLKSEFLEPTLEILIARHDALRLGFKMSDGGPVQFVIDDIKAPLAYHNYSDVNKRRSLEDKLVNEKFEWEKPPYFKFVHISCPQQSSLILVMHHLIFDAWSMYILMNEVLNTYSALANGSSTLLKQKAYPFKNFVNQYENLQSHQKLIDARSFWTRNLSNAQWSINLPYKKQSDSESNYKVVFGELGKKETEDLMKLSQENKFSMFHILLAGLFMSLNRETGRNDMIIRVANANRDYNYPGIDSITGCLADSLPIRLEIEDEEDLLKVASKAKNVMFAALRHSCMSSQDIAELPIERKDNGPLVVSPVGLSFIPIHHLSESASYNKNILCRSALPFTDISLICFLKNNQLKCCWNYDEALFESKDIERMNNFFLNSMTKEFGTPSNTNIENVFPELEIPSVNLFPEYATLHDKVWAACDRFADRTAIISGEQKLTYQELGDRSKRVASTILEELDEDEEAVCIYDYPSIEATIGITGIMASGRAFIPLDPDWPLGRVQDIISHANVKTIVTVQAHIPNLLSDGNSLDKIERIIVVGEYVEKIIENQHVTLIEGEDNSRSIQDFAPNQDPKKIAYIMYTSGTSGRPKGVMVSHFAVNVFLNWISETFSIGKDDRFIHTSSLGFGGSLRQIFSTILAGSCNYPIPRLELKDPESLFDFLSKNKITLFNTVPSIINSLLDHAENNVLDAERYLYLPHLRFLLLGGEKLSSKTVLRWRKYFPNQGNIANLYGSTETIVNATVHIILPDTKINVNENIPLGRQKKGSIVRLLNPKGELCKEGETGEIYVGGPCIADGYYNEADLTKKQFVKLDDKNGSHPFYKTGDLGKFNSDGLIYFSGRNDSQVQVHGNRVELGEIEHVISLLDQVKSVVVLDHKSEMNHVLTAFIVLSKKGIQPNTKQIRNYVAEKLPSYMLPHRIIFMEALPLNQAGKTDRLSLRKILIEENKEVSDQERKSLLSSSELIIASVWEDLLQIKGIQAKDDFFRIGGDSILALQMLHQLKKHFPILPRAVTLFNDRKLCDLAISLDRLNENNLPINTPDTKVQEQNIPLSASQKGFLFLNKLYPDSSPNWSGQLYFNGVFKPELFVKALDVLIERHPMLRTVFRNEGSKTYQNVVKDIISPVQVFDISDDSKETQLETLDKTYSKFRNINFDLEDFPLFKVQFHKTGERSGVMIISMHHIITDGWSTHILMNELLQAYDQLINGLEINLGNKPPHFGECLPFMNPSLSPIDLEKNKDFWQNILHDTSPYIPSKNENSNDSLIFVLPSNSKELLSNYAMGNGSTLYNLMLTLFTRALLKMYVLDSALINTAINGRDIPVENIHKIVACFARNLPLKLSLEEGNDLISDLKIVENSLYEAMKHQEIPTPELLKIASKNGLISAIISLNRFYFSFMDYSALGSYENSIINLDWDESVFNFDAGGAGSELMTSVNINHEIRISVNGYSSFKQKEEFKTLFLDELKSLEGVTPILDTALISYFPGGKWLKSLMNNLNSNGSLAKWSEKLMVTGNPSLLEWTTTPFGISGVIFIPYSSDELLTFSLTRRVSEIKKAIELASVHGAKYISMAGILPAITNYGYAVAKEMNLKWKDENSITLTTGHSSTVVAVVKTIEKALIESGGKIEEKSVGVIGYGSIGQSSLSLLLTKLGHPSRILIVDLEEQLPHLQKSIDKLRTEFQGNIDIKGVKRNKVCAELFDCDLIIGASSAGQLIDVSRFKEGSILVDDSFPPLIDIASGVSRMKNSKDVLLLGGGKLKLEELRESEFNKNVPTKILKPLLQHLGEDGMPGCRAEALLLYNNSNLPSTIGLVRDENAEIFWDECTKLGVTASELHLGGFTISDELLTNFKTQLIPSEK